MRLRMFSAVIVLLALAEPTFAHRLDEYLQATTVTLAKDHIVLQMRLTPGVQVFDKVFKAIDTDGDGIISEAEKEGYADRVRSDLALNVDGKRLPLRLVSRTFPEVEEMKAGMGDIVLDLEADVPRGGSGRRLTLENHHLAGISVYLANCLVPRDPDIHIAAQDRSYDQSFYRLDYSEAVAGTIQQPSSESQDATEWMGRTGTRSLFKAYIYLGIHHILTGYDHLLFVSALVLAATTLWDVVKVVFTFTLAHSITLTLAAMNLSHLPERVVEPLISASIIFVALQNVFWPRNARGWSRLAAAFFFGLFHGLGFAGGLLEAMRQMPSGTMFLAIGAFSIGVEAGHQMVVLPLFAILKAARQTQSDAVKRTQLSMAFQRIGSAGISIAGCFYLWLALAGQT